ncbi:MAG TPA: hypothetical protein VJN88_09205 [Ktedonobacterales bacterium]|nr:hypothetical protein [Ktedonobacterales bacterium]
MSNVSDSQPQGAPAPQALATLDATTLLFLFADRVLPLIKKQPEHPEMHCAFAKVDGTTLAADLLACAMWELRGQGFVQLQVAEEKVLFVKTTVTHVQRLRTGTTTGLANGLLQKITDKPKETAKSVMDHWFGKDYPSPTGVVLGVPLAAAEQLGLINKVETDRPNVMAKVFKAKYHLEPNLAGIAAYESAFSAFAAAWLAFKTNEAALYQQLVKAARSSISAHQEREDNDNF